MRNLRNYTWLRNNGFGCMCRMLISSTEMSVKGRAHGKGLAWVRNAHSDSIVSACRGHRGCHASLHYLLAPPVMAVCFYGDGPCGPLKEEWKEQSGQDDGQAVRKEGAKKRRVSEEGRATGRRKILSSGSLGLQTGNEPNGRHLIYICCESINIMIVVTSRAMESTITVWDGCIDSQI